MTTSKFARSASNETKTEPRSESTRRSRRAVASFAHGGREGVASNASKSANGIPFQKQNLKATPKPGGLVSRQRPALTRTGRGLDVAQARSDGDDSDDIAAAIKIHIRRVTKKPASRRQRLGKPVGNGRTLRRRRAPKVDLVNEVEEGLDEEEESLDGSYASSRHVRSHSASDSDAEDDGKPHIFVTDSEKNNDDDDDDESEPIPVRRRRRGLRAIAAREPRKPARKKKLLPPPPPSPPPQELTKEERQARLDELVKQSAEISKQLNAAIDLNRATMPELSQDKQMSQTSAGAEDWETLCLPIAPGRALQPHQIDGVKWFLKLDESGHNGILADSMGTGKTLQTVSLSL
jgi:SNF2 family DNA or RNA helicase